MPLALERKLKKQAHKKHLSDKEEGAYIYGTMRKTGWEPEQEKRYPRGSKKSK